MSEMETKWKQGRNPQTLTPFNNGEIEVEKLQRFTPMLVAKWAGPASLL